MSAPAINVRVHYYRCREGHYHERVDLPGGQARDRIVDPGALPKWVKEICRDERGRFATCGGGDGGGSSGPGGRTGRTAAEWRQERADRLNAAHDAILAMVTHETRPISLPKIRAAHDALAKLTVEQLKKVRDTYTLKKVSAKTKDELKNRILAKLHDSVRPGPSGPAAQTGGAEAHDADAHVKAGTFGDSKNLTYQGDAASRRLADQAAKALLGPGKKAEDLASLCGTPDGSKFNVTHYKDFNGQKGRTRTVVQFSGSVPVKDPETGLTENKNYTGTRSVNVKPDGTKYIHNDYFRGEGSGLKMFGREVEHATAAGFDHIETHAAGEFVAGPDSNKTYGTYNGYYTWPRFGYNDKVPDHVYSRLPDGLKASVDAHDGMVSGLMGTKEGRSFWLRNGEDLFHAKFDLRPGSYSQQTLTAYLKAQGLT